MPINEGRIKLRHLQCFQAVVRQRSIEGAARQLSLSQPAVSKTIAELEDALGARLFERSRRGTLPTPAAERFLRHADASLDALRQGIAALTGAPDEAPVLRVGLLPTVGQALLPKAWVRLRENWPRAVLQLRTGANAALLDWLRAGEVDLVVGRLSEPERMSALVFEQLFSEPLCLVVRPGHPLLVPGAGRLDDFPLVLPERGTVIRHAADGLLERLDARARTGSVETLSVSLARALVRGSDAVWVVPASAVEADLADGVLARLPLLEVGQEEPVGLIQRSGPPAGAALGALAAALREVARQRRARRPRRTG